MCCRDRIYASFLAVFALGVAGCSSDSKPGPDDGAFEAKVTSGMHDGLLDDLTTLVAAAGDLQNAAPTPTGRGWDETQDADSIAAMKTAWVAARGAYEHMEGAVAPLFYDIDHSIDARYEDYLDDLGNVADPDLFDGNGVRGLHGVERILYSDVTPDRIVTFEKALVGYSTARFPQTEAEAREFKTSLCAKVITDATTLRDEWESSRLDLQGAFGGLVALMNEQREKVNKASSGEEESRYSQRTMADIRDNLDGTTAIYALFSPWIVSKPGGGASDQKTRDGLAALGQAYAKDPEDAIPAPPPGWSIDASSADLATPFGQLYSTVQASVDPTRDGSIVFEMDHSAGLLGFPEFEAMP